MDYIEAQKQIAEKSHRELCKKAGQRVVKFINDLKHTGDYRGQPFDLRPFQEKIVRPIFGRLDHNGKRIINEAFVMLPKKQGKTELMAAIALYCLLGLGKSGQSIILAASSREQASKLFDAAADMIRQDPYLSDLVQIYESKKRIVYEQKSNFVLAISSDSKTAHGENPSVVLFDELHAQSSRKLWDTLKNSMGTRQEPLWISITHAGYDRTSLAHEQFEYAVKVQNGIIDNPHFLPVLYYATPEDKWDDPAVWRRVNPALGDFYSFDHFKAEFTKAKDVPSEENAFRMYHLNQWVTQAIRWLPMDHYNACPNVLDEKSLEGKPCWAGLDLASVSDFNALVLVFSESENQIVLPYFWMPEEAVHKNDDYLRWAKQGFIKMTPGNVSDYDVIRADINALNERFNIQKIAVDRWGATQLVTQLDGDGFNLEYHGQGFKSMNAPSKELERLILGHRLNHGNNPVLKWMASNVSAEIDAAGNIKPSKKRSKEKIDGVVSLVMALTLAIQPEQAAPSITCF